MFTVRQQVGPDWPLADVALTAVRRYAPDGAPLGVIAAECEVDRRRLLPVLRALAGDRLIRRTGRRWVAV